MKIVLQHDSTIPLYIQLHDLLQKQIQRGEYPIGARLPSERELSQQFGVSRMTARQALQALVQEGVAQSSVGRGTFVKEPRIDQQLRSLTSFTQDIGQKGMVATSIVLQAQVSTHEDDAIQRLQLAEGAEVIKLVRLRMADHSPLAIETSYLPHWLCLNILDHHDFSDESLYRVLRENYGLHLTWADQTIQTRLPDDQERSRLQIATQIPVLDMNRITYTENETPVEFVQSVYRGDRYQFHARLVSDPKLLQTQGVETLTHIEVQS